MTMQFDYVLEKEPKLWTSNSFVGIYLWSDRDYEGPKLIVKNGHCSGTTYYAWEGNDDHKSGHRKMTFTTSFDESGTKSSQLNIEDTENGNKVLHNVFSSVGVSFEAPE